MATFRPNQLADGSAGSGSLRDAILQANANDENDIIELASGATYTLSIEGRGEDDSATGDLDIAPNNSTLTIRGLGEGATIDARQIDRVFHLLSDFRGNTSTLILENLTITGGLSGGDVLDDDGGGILVEESTLVVSNSTISGNTASGFNLLGGDRLGGNGGGIFNRGSTSLNNVVLENNRANTRGGGLSNYYAVAEIDNSTISGNLALDFDVEPGETTTASGGGLSHEGTGSLTVNNSTVTGNSAAFSGGGILNSSIRSTNTGTVTVTNSRIAQGKRIQISAPRPNRGFSNLAWPNSALHSQ